jgi:hypothetical protein
LHAGSIIMTHAVGGDYEPYEQQIIRRIHPTR